MSILKKNFWGRLEGLRFREPTSLPLVYLGPINHIKIVYMIYINAAGCDAITMLSNVLVNGKMTAVLIFN